MKPATARAALQALTGKELTDAMLKEALAVVDENRRLLRELFDYRKEANPKASSRARSCSWPAASKRAPLRTKRL